jgi:hypothetical protein
VARGVAQSTVNKLAKRFAGWFGVMLFVGTVAVMSARCGSSSPHDMWIDRDPDAGAGFDAPAREVGGGGAGGTGGAAGAAGAVGTDGAAGQGVGGGDTGLPGAAGTGGAAGDGTAGGAGGQ